MKQQVKNEQDKKKTYFFLTFCKCLNSKKTSSRLFKKFIGNKNNNKENDLEKLLVTMIIT